MTSGDEHAFAANPDARARRSLALSVAPLAVALTLSCVSVQDFPDPEASVDGTQEPPAFVPSNDDPATWRWQWANPVPTGNALNAINGTADDDVWVAGDGVIAHWNGTTWDPPRVASDGTRYLAIGVRGPKDVWVAGGTANDARVVHFDGTTWTESYPFAGAVFGGFSHGAGKRLFAIVDLKLVELTPDGKWTSSTTGMGLVERGPVVDVWVSSSDDAWAITTGALEAPTLLHAAPGSATWEKVGPDLPRGSTGVSISGAGAIGCAFITGGTNEADPDRTGIGFLSYDQKEWRLGVRARSSPFEVPSIGATSACFRGGVGAIVAKNKVLEVTLDGKVVDTSGTEFGIVKRAAWSADGRAGYVVGDRGLFVARAWDDRAANWYEPGPTNRNDLHDIDVGLDGAVLAVDALRTISPKGGEILGWEGRWKRRSDPVVHRGPPFPVAVTVIGDGDAWIASDEGGRVGVSHYTGQWPVPTVLDGTPAPDEEALAIWAPAKDDVWLSGRERCADEDLSAGTPCSKTVASFVAHFDGSSWATFPTNGASFSIHGTGPNDVWFAGEGVAHWDGHVLTAVPALDGHFEGVWSSAVGRVWLWGDDAILYDGVTTTPVEKALNAAAEWAVSGIAESSAGDVFVLTRRSTGTALLRFDPSRSRLVEQVSSDLSLTKIRGRKNQLWAIGEGGASLRFAPPVLR